MGSKKFKGKLCVYCTEKQSETADHVISRGFFPKNLREGIPKVPACVECNADKAALEHYLTAFLPIGATSNTAMAVLEQDVERRLEKNQRLARELKFCSKILWDESESGLYLPGVKLPINADFMEALFRMMGRGLAWHHFEVLIDNSCLIEARALTMAGEKKFKESFFSDTDNCVTGDLGVGGFQYIGRKSPKEGRVTWWLMRFYSGMEIVDSESDENSQCMFVASGPKEIYESLHLDVKYGLV